MNKTIFVVFALATVPFIGNVAALPAGCGPVVDSCGGMTPDPFYAGCNGAWRDIYQSGTYGQACVEGDGTVHVWACPNSYSYSVNSPACTHVATP